MSSRGVASPRKRRRPLFGRRHRCGICRTCAFVRCPDRYRKPQGRSSEFRGTAAGRQVRAGDDRALGGASGERGVMKGLRKQFTSTLVILLLALALWGYVVGPMFATFEQSITGIGGGAAEYWKFFDLRNGAQGESMLGSIVISVLSVLTSGVTGVFLAVLLKRWEFPLRSVCQVLVLVPIALPPLMGVQAFVLLFGIGGTIPQVLGSLFHMKPASFAVDGVSGVLLVHTLTMYPYFYLTVAAALDQSDDSLEEASYSLGASRFQTWTRVLLPMLTPAVAAGSMLTFMSSIASYTAP